MKKNRILLIVGLFSTIVVIVAGFAIADPFNIFYENTESNSLKAYKNEKVYDKTIEIIDNKDKKEENTEKKDGIHDDTIKEEKNLSINGLKDGIYFGSSKGYGGDIKVKVTLANGKIHNVQVASHSETPQFYDNGSKVIHNIIEANSTNVDSISGATLTSNGIKNAVRNALSNVGIKEAKSNEKEEKIDNKKYRTKDIVGTKEETINQHKIKGEKVKNIIYRKERLKDGEYIGEAWGYKGNIKVKTFINNGKLQHINIINHNDDEVFFNNAKKIIDKILQSQNPKTVDTVSGATYSSKGIIDAVNDSLKKALVKQNSTNKIIEKPTNIMEKVNNLVNDINLNKKVETNSTKSKEKDTNTNISKEIEKKSISDKNEKISNINNNVIQYQDGDYIGKGIGFHTNKSIKTIVTFKDNKIKRIQVATKASGDYGDDGDGFRLRAMEVVDPLLGNDCEKTIKDLLLHERMVNEILNSENPYEKAKQLIGNYGEPVKEVSDGYELKGKVYYCVKRYLKEHNKASVFDTVSGATYSARGIAKSVKDAMNKSINDFSTGNTIRNLEVKTPKSKVMNVNKIEKLDLSKLKIILANKNGEKKEIGYDKFKENGIELYERDTKKPIYDGMDLSKRKAYSGIEVIIEHKKSLYKDMITIIPENINKNYITGIDYSLDNGKTWSGISQLEFYKDNINFRQTVNMPIELKDKPIIMRLMSSNKDMYILKPEYNDELKIDNKEYYLEVNKKHRESNSNIPSSMVIKFNILDNTESDEIKQNKALEKIDYVQIFTAGSKIDKMGARIKVGEKIDWTGTRFKFLDNHRDNILNLFTKKQLENGLREPEKTKKYGIFYYEDLEKLGIEISPKQRDSVTESMIPQGSRIVEPEIILTYKGNEYKVKSNAKFSADTVGIFLERDKV